MTITWNLGQFYAEWSRIKRRSQDAATFFVRWKAKRLCQALAYHTPIAEFRDENGKIIYARGRARAGWWPSALGLGAHSVYTRHRNRGEGRVQDASGDYANPTITMTNAVPYIMDIKGHGNWAMQAVEQETASAQKQLEQSYRRHLSSGL